jgi:hypothetical protein
LPLSLLLIGAVFAARLEHLRNLRLLHECFQVIIGFLPICILIRWMRLFPRGPLHSRYRPTTRDFFVMTALLAALLVVGNFEGYVKGSSIYNVSINSLVFFGASQSMFALALFLSVKRAHKASLCLALLLAIAVCVDFEFHWIANEPRVLGMFEGKMWMARAVLMSGILGFTYLPCAIHLVLARDKSASNPVVQSGLS